MIILTLSCQGPSEAHVECDKVSWQTTAVTGQEMSKPNIHECLVSQTSNRPGSGTAQKPQVLWRFTVMRNVFSKQILYIILAPQHQASLPISTSWRRSPFITACKWRLYENSRVVKQSPCGCEEERCVISVLWVTGMQLASTWSHHEKTTPGHHRHRSVICLCTQLKSDWLWCQCLYVLYVYYTMIRHTSADVMYPFIYQSGSTLDDLISIGMCIAFVSLSADYIIIQQKYISSPQYAVYQYGVPEMNESFIPLSFCSHSIWDSPLNIRDTSHISRSETVWSVRQMLEQSAGQHGAAPLDASRFMTRRKRKKSVENGGQIIITDLLGGWFISLHLRPILISLT